MLRSHCHCQSNHNCGNEFSSGPTSSVLSGTPAGAHGPLVLTIHIDFLIYYADISKSLPFNTFSKFLITIYLFL